MNNAKAERWGDIIPNSQLELIRQYCDTTGIRLSGYEKDLLCKVLENPARYDGFISQLYTDENSGKDYRGRWDSTTKWQYRINIGSSLSIDKRYYHACDGYVQDGHWEWPNAWHITETRRILEVLREIAHEL